MTIPAIKVWLLGDASSTEKVQAILKALSKSGEAVLKNMPYDSDALNRRRAEIFYPYLFSDQGDEVKRIAPMPDDPSTINEAPNVIDDPDVINVFIHCVDLKNNVSDIPKTLETIRQTRVSFPTVSHQLMGIVDPPCGDNRRWDENRSVAFHAFAREQGMKVGSNANLTTVDDLNEPALRQYFNLLFDFNNTRYEHVKKRFKSRIADLDLESKTLWETFLENRSTLTVSHIAQLENATNLLNQVENPSSQSLLQKFNAIEEYENNDKYEDKDEAICPYYYQLFFKQCIDELARSDGSLINQAWIAFKELIDRESDEKLKSSLRLNSLRLMKCLQDPSSTPKNKLDALEQFYKDSVQTTYKKAKVRFLPFSIVLGVLLAATFCAACIVPPLLVAATTTALAWSIIGGVFAAMIGFVVGTDASSKYFINRAQKKHQFFVEDGSELTKAVTQICNEAMENLIKEEEKKSVDERKLPSSWS